MDNSVYLYNGNIVYPDFKAKSIKSGTERDLYIDLDDYVNEIYLDRKRRLGNFKARKISVGGASAFIDFNDNIFIYGPNRFGECGLGTNAEILGPTLVPDIKAKMISCGGSHTMIVTTNNELYASGYNDQGQCGLPKTVDRVSRFTKVNFVDFPVKYAQCQSGYTLIIDYMNNLYCLGTSPIDRERGLIKIWSGCNRVSGTANNIVFTDMDDSVYFVGKVIMTRLMSGYLTTYNMYESKGVELIPGIKARNIQSSYLDTLNVIGTRIKRESAPTYPWENYNDYMSYEQILALNTIIQQ